MGNKVCLKVDSKVSIVMEQVLRLLHHCGMPMTDVDFINSDGSTMHAFLLKSLPRMTQFTGSSKVGEVLARDLHGKIKLEDAGWDWKVTTHYQYLASPSLSSIIKHHKPAHAYNVIIINNINLLLYRS